MPDPRETLPDSAAATDPVVDWSLEELAAYIDHELVEVRGPDRPKGWITSKEYAAQKGITKGTADSRLACLVDAGRLDQGLFWDDETHQQVRAYHPKGGSLVDSP